MMYIWAILRNDLACYWKDRPALFWTFAGPLVCAALFGYLTQPKAGPPPAVILIDEGAGADVTRQCAGTLTAKGRQVRIETHIEQDNWNVELKRDDTGVIFRLNGRETELDDERLLRFELESALVKISLPQISAPVQVRQLEPDRATPSGSIVRGFQRSIPAYLLMFLTLNLLVSGANLAEDRQSGRLRRLLHSPIGVPRLIAGKLASRLLVALAQITLLLLLGRMAFGISLGDRPGMTILLLCLYTLAIGSSGVLLGALIHDPDQAQATAVNGGLSWLGQQRIGIPDWALKVGGLAASQGLRRAGDAWDWVNCDDEDPN